MGMRERAFEVSRVRKAKVVPTPFGDVEVRSLRGGEFDELAGRQKGAGVSLQNALLAVACLFVPGSDERVFGWDDAEALAAGDAGLLLDLAEACDDVNGLSERARGKAQTPASGGGGTSPAPSASPPAT